MCYKVEFHALIVIITYCVRHSFNCIQPLNMTYDVALENIILPTGAEPWNVVIAQKLFLGMIFLFQWLVAVERLSILYHSADYISFPLGSLGPLWNFWIWCSAHVYARGRKQCCKLHYCLWRISIKPRLPFSSLWCVLCFQRQSFWRLCINS